jgi:hypothetical protein
VALRPNAVHGLLILEVSRSHTTTHHSRYDSSGRMISSSQRPLPDNTQHSQHTHFHAPGWIQTHSAGERPQTYALDRVANWTGTSMIMCCSNILRVKIISDEIYKGNHNTHFMLNSLSFFENRAIHEMTWKKKL